MKESFISDNSAKLGFSKDTVLFDTVFTPLSTPTKVLMVYNPYSKSIKISSLQLAGGSGSFYKINVNGSNGSSFSNIEILPHDSMYIFVAAKLSEVGQDKPLLVRDSLIFNINGNSQKVMLVSYGQDVVVLKNVHLKTQTWTSNKPYLIFGTVTVDSNQVLTLEAGSRVYLYYNAGINIYGTLKINGETNNRVLFHQTRLENDYYDQAGQWGKISLMSSSKNNVIENCDIWSPVTGIEIGEPAQSAVPDLVIRNTMIINAKASLIRSFGAHILAENCVLGNAGESCVEMYKGGKYQFYHCTIYNGGISSRPAITFPDFYYNDKYTDIITKAEYSGTLDSIAVYNTIIYGNSPDMSITSANANYYFKNSILRADWDVFNKNDAMHFDSIIYDVKLPLLKMTNVDTDKKEKYDFTPDSMSQARAKASYSIAAKYPVDLKGNSRIIDGKPDIGALQWQPAKK